MWAIVHATPVETLLAASAIFTLALAALVVALAKTEFGKAARRRRRLRQALARSQRTRALAAAAARGAGGLTPEELARLEALRARAGLLADEPLGRPSWWRTLRSLWREGYAGWIIAALGGAFSMATHFGAFWLIAGGGWLGAILITLLATALMVAACVWIGLGLLRAG